MRASRIISPIAAVILASSISAHGQVSWGGFEWQPLGQAQLSVTAGGLQVSDIGSSGNDGVSLLLPNGIPNGVSLIDLDTDVPTDPPPGAFFQQAGVGTINGVANQVAETVTTTITPGGGVNYVPNFSALAPSSLGCDYYLQGTEVLSETGINPITSASALVRWGVNTMTYFSS